MALLVLFYDINFNFLYDLRVIYEFRQDMSISLPVINSFVVYAALPTLIYVAILQKRYIWLLPLASIGPLLYMISGHKFFSSYRFYILFAIIIRCYSSGWRLYDSLYCADANDDWIVARQYLGDFR